MEVPVQLATTPSVVHPAGHSAVLSVETSRSHVDVPSVAGVALLPASVPAQVVAAEAATLAQPLGHASVPSVEASRSHVWTGCVQTYGVQPDRL